MRDYKDSSIINSLFTDIYKLLLAERVGFEPTVEFPLHTLSKRAPSTTRTSLRLKSTTCERSDIDYRTRHGRAKNLARTRFPPVVCSLTRTRVRRNLCQTTQHPPITYGIRSSAGHCGFVESGPNGGSCRLVSRSDHLMFRPISAKRSWCT